MTLLLRACVVVVLCVAAVGAVTGTNSVPTRTHVVINNGDMDESSDFVQAELFPAEPKDGSSALVEEWSNFIMGMSGLLSVNEHTHEPNVNPHYLAPDQRSTPGYGGYDTQTNYDYEWQRIGKVLPNDLTPFTEGYRPPKHGYFQQSADCDQFMRMYMDQCAFKDEGENVYHAGPKPFLKGYLAGVMEKWEKQSDMVKSAARFGGQAKSQEEEAPTAIDDQQSPMAIVSE